MESGNNHVILSILIIFGIIFSNLTNQQLARRLVCHDGNGMTHDDSYRTCSRIELKS